MLYGGRSDYWKITLDWQYSLSLKRSKYFEQVSIPRQEVMTMALGAHGHERTGVEVLRVLCSKCGNRVSLDPGENEAKCPKCGTLAKRPRTEKPKETE